MLKTTPWSMTAWDMYEDKFCHQGFDIQDKDGNFIASIKNECFFPDKEEMIKTANLLFAAPDIYRALKAIIDSAEMPYCESDPLVVAARIAIKKAERGRE